MSNKKANTVTLPFPKAKTKKLVVQNLEDELLIYNLQTNQAMCLNQTAALVWRYCDGKSGVNEIKQKLEEELGASVQEELVLFAISGLNEKGLIETGEEISKGFEGLTRREIVRKVGFASLVALPIVSSIVAPKASSAQTPRVCPPGTLPSGAIYRTRDVIAISIPTADRTCNNNTITNVRTVCCSQSGSSANCTGMFPRLTCDCVCD